MQNSLSTNDNHYCLCCHLHYTGIFFVYLIVSDCFIIAMTIVVMRMFYQQGDKEVPACLLTICFVGAREKRSDGLQNADNWKEVARMTCKYLCAVVTIVTVIVMVTLGSLFAGRSK